MAADFTFDINAKDTPLTQLAPLFSRILGPEKGKPTVTLGAGVQRGAAVTWLREQQDRYSKSLGGRSQLIKNMDLPKRVVLQDVVDESDA